MSFYPVASLKVLHYLILRALINLNIKKDKLLNKIGVIYLYCIVKWKFVINQNKLFDDEQPLFKV